MLHCQIKSQRIQNSKHSDGDIIEVFKEIKGGGWLKKNISDDVEKIGEALEEVVDFNEEESDLSSDGTGEDIQDPKIKLRKVKV